MVALPHPTKVGESIAIDDDAAPLQLVAWGIEYGDLQLRSRLQLKLHKILHTLDSRRLDMLAAELEEAARMIRENR